MHIVRFAMARIAFLFTAAVLINFAAAFAPSSVQGAAVGAGSSNAASSASALGMADTDAYDVVKVDLDDGRDYPIYIGAEFDEAEGEQRAVFLLGFAVKAPGKLVKCRFVLANLICLVFIYRSANSRRLPCSSYLLSFNVSNIPKQLERSFVRTSREIVLLLLPMIGLPRFTSTNTRQ